MSHDTYTHAEDGRICALVEDGTWFVPLDVGGEGYACERKHGPATKQLVLGDIPIEVLARQLYDAVTIVKMRADARDGLRTGTPSWDSAGDRIRGEYREIVAALALHGGYTIPGVALSEHTRVTLDGYRGTVLDPARATGAADD